MSWVYRIDPAYDPGGEVPGHAVIAAAPSDGGSVIGPWQHNPNYRPSVLARMLERSPADAFLAEYGAFLRGERPAPAFRATFAATEFDVLAADSGDALLVVNLGEGEAFVLFSSAEFTDEGSMTIRLSGAQILEFMIGRAGVMIDRCEIGALWIPLSVLVGADEGGRA